MFLLATAALVVWIIVWLIVAYRVVIRHDLGVAAQGALDRPDPDLPDRRAARLLPVGRREAAHHLTRKDEAEGERFELSRGLHP